MRHVVFEAQTFAYLAHQGTLDERESYFATAAATVRDTARLGTSRENVAAAAWLYHAVTYTPATLADAEARGFPPEVIALAREAHAFTGGAALVG